MIPLPPDPPSSSAPPPSRLATSLAVVGLVLALVPCCPLTGLAGSALGLVAYARLRRPVLGADGAPVAPGRRLILVRRVAALAVFLGAVMCIVWAVVLDRVATRQQAAQADAIVALVDEVVGAAVHAAGSDGAAPMPGLGDTWTPGAERPSPEARRTFGSEILARYGPYEGFTVVSSVRSGPLLAPMVEAAGVFRCAGGRPLGSVRIDIRAVPGRFTPVHTVSRITIEDDEHGDLVLGGPRSPEGAAPAPIDGSP